MLLLSYQSVQSIRIYNLYSLIIRRQMRMAIKNVGFNFCVFLSRSSLGILHENYTFVVLFSFESVQKINYSCIGYRWFLINTKWWTLSISFIESNMITIAYNTFSQLRPNSTSYFSFDNKLNFTFAYNIMFIFMAYAFCFYILVYRYLARSAAHGLLNFSKFGFCGFFVESCCRISRNLIKGSIHSYFLQNPKTQLACLLASDILFFIFSIHLTKSFKHKITRILYISYYLFFLIFDLVLYLYYFTSLNKSSQQLTYQKFDTLELIIICILIGIVSVLTLAQIIISVRQFVYKFNRMRILLTIRNLQVNGQKSVHENNANDNDNNIKIGNFLQPQQHHHIFIKVQKLNHSPTISKKYPIQVNPPQPNLKPSSKSSKSSQNKNNSKHATNNNCYVIFDYPIQENLGQEQSVKYSLQNFNEIKKNCDGIKENRKSQQKYLHPLPKLKKTRSNMSLQSRKNKNKIHKDRNMIQKQTSSSKLARQQSNIFADYVSNDDQFSPSSNMNATAAKKDQYPKTDAPKTPKHNKLNNITVSYL